MASNFKEKIQYINNNNPISSFTFLKELPDICPVCNYGISPEYILFYKDKYSPLLLCGCPRNDCRAIFFTRYMELRDQLYLNGFLPRVRFRKEFPNEIKELSPDFVEIYEQANLADEEGLDLICGVGFRKALEYLIKDYVLRLYPEDDSKIKSMPLQQCIQKFINEPSIKLMAERATWLGNDETHYIRRFEDKDIQDLINLIDLTVYFISMSLKALRYHAEMVR